MNPEKVNFPLTIFGPSSGYLNLPLMFRIRSLQERAIEEESGRRLNLHLSALYPSMLGWMPWNLKNQVDWLTLLRSFQDGTSVRSPTSRPLCFQKIYLSLSINGLFNTVTIPGRCGLLKAKATIAHKITKYFIFVCFQ